jgi:hypothetical protein
MKGSPFCLLCYGEFLSQMIAEHSDHCRACKERVRQLLTAVYGECQVNYSFPWPANPREYEDTNVGETLRKVFVRLQNLRDHRDFVKSAQVPRCDFYISDPPFILEFDESQHFTRARLVSLSGYPADFDAGFSLTQWKDLCRLIDARDDDPPDRDERRAWYDTLRDMVPTLHGFKPTARFYANEFRWCSLESESKKDQETFCSIFEGRLPLPRNGGAK